MTVAICDDESTVLNALCDKISEVFANEGHPVTPFRTTGPFELLEYLNRDAPDVLFLDIDMPQLNGMEIAESLLNAEKRTLLIFVTNHDALVYRSFRYHPFGFIRKSYFDEEIAEVVQRILAERAKRREMFSFRAKEGLCRLPFDEILYFEAEANYISLHGKERSYHFRDTMKHLEQELVPKGFIRIHKGFLINGKHVFAIKGNEIQLTDSEMLPIGRTNRDSVREAVLRGMR